jgi:protein sidekick
MMIFLFNARTIPSIFSLNLKRFEIEVLIPKLHRFRSLHELRTLWMKDGIPIENSRISYSFNDSWNRTLALISANITYTGIYSCHVDLRSGGYPTVNASAKIVVYGKH